MTTTKTPTGVSKKRIAQGIALLFLVSFTTTACVKIKKTPDQNNTPTEQSNNNENSANTPKEKPQTVLAQLKAQGKVKKFKNEEDFAEFFESKNENNALVYQNEMMRKDMDMTYIDVELSDSLEKSIPKAESKTIGKSDDFSKTNVQVEGVDEADIVKTDGKHIFALTKNSLLIIDAFPAKDSKVLSEIKFKSRPENIYINDNKLVVYGNNHYIHEYSAFNRFKRKSSYTFLKVFDISDPKNPKQVRDLDIEGGYTDSRMIGDYVYFITTTYNYRYFSEEPISPRIMENGEVLASKCANADKCFEPEIYYFDIPYSNYKFTTLTSINVKEDNKDIKGEVYLLSGNQKMFVSLKNIYITFTKTLSEYDLESEIIKELIFPRLPTKDQDKITKIEAVENFILTKRERMRKVREIIERFAESLTKTEQEKLEKDLESAMIVKHKSLEKELEKTIIHKIEINKDNIEYKTFGEVTGRVLNQFSMDENEGYFRIATTRSRNWSRYDELETKSYNNMYVLDSNMKVVGSLEGLAEDEKIYSVRFMQNRAYMVTFKQIDPLFVIDLKDPKNPTVLGKLKIPGYSDYLHPYDNETLIGLGKDTYLTESGGVRTKGLKLSLFDVSKVSEPKEIDTFILGDAGSDSIALRDHKAFLFSKEKNLISIPVRLRESTDEFSYGKFAFGGAAVFKVTKEGFELKGKIDHAEGEQGEQDNWRGYGYYNNSVKRSLYIDKTLYTISEKYLKMNNIENLDPIKKLELRKKQGEDDFEIIN